MTSDEFVRDIEVVVRDAAVESTVSNLVDPPGRTPVADLRVASDFYRGLNKSQQAIVHYIIRRAANYATVGFLTVLDGARELPSIDGDGRLDVLYTHPKHTTLLNDIDRAPLNSKFRP